MLHYRHDCVLRFGNVLKEDRRIYDAWKIIVMNLNRLSLYISMHSPFFSLRGVSLFSNSIHGHRHRFVIILLFVKIYSFIGTYCVMLKSIKCYWLTTLLIENHKCVTLAGCFQAGFEYYAFVSLSIWRIITYCSRLYTEQTKVTIIILILLQCANSWILIVATNNNNNNHKYRYLCTRLSPSSR